MQKKKNKLTVAGKDLAIEYVPVTSLRPAPYNPRTWTKEATGQLKESIKGFGVIDPILANSAPARRGIDPDPIY
jgi:ParB-like chromosome segregation protein Spo0J